MEKLPIKLVVIGGGTGSFTLLHTFKDNFSDITALVNMADDGGSSGALRDELGVLPPGDVRQCLVALSDSDEIRELFNYRFDNGSLKGHTVGNIFLSALEKTSGSFAQAVKSASRILKIEGTVIPITTVNTKLILKTSSSKSLTGQYSIESADMSGMNEPELSREPMADINPEAKVAISGADVIVIAPGNLYASLAPVLLVKGISEALKESMAKKVYVCNLVTKPGQTDNYEVNDFAAEIERFAGVEFLDYVIYNNDKPTNELLNKYTHDGEYLVGYNESTLQSQHYKTKGLPLIAKEMVKHKVGDPLVNTRSLIRHDPSLLIQEIISLCNN